MELDDRLLRRFELLLMRDESDLPTPRLLQDARRFVGRARSLALLVKVNQPDFAAIALACLALQLPMRTADGFPIGKFGQINLRERAQQAAELLLTLMEPHVEPDLLGRATQLLTDLPQRSTRNESARLLADAINLDDFGLTGLLNSAVIGGSRGNGIDVLMDGHRKRDAYGYWDARLADGFHFVPVRDIALKRLNAARDVLKLLETELRDDGAA